MHISKSIIEETEYKIMEYYKNMKEIQWQKRKVENLKSRLKKIKEDIQNCNINLETSQVAINYNVDRVQGGKLPSSSMDRDIDRIFEKLEKEIEGINKERLETGLVIRELESKNEKIEYIINLLDEESKLLIVCKYKEKRSYESIAYQLNTTNSNITKKRNNILIDLSKWFLTSE